METYTTLRNLYGELTFNNSANNLAVGDTLINGSIKKILNKRAWPFLFKTQQQDTLNNTQFYNLPYDFGKLTRNGVTVTPSGSTQYTPQEVPSIGFWNKLNQSSITSNIPEWIIILNGQIGFWPIVSTGTANAIEYTYKRRFKDLSIADYSVGSIGTATAGTTTILGNTASGSTTSWTTKMAGRWIRITDNNVANAGDGEWYEINSVSNATTMVLKRAYAGVNISEGTAAYIIGQISPIPEGFDDAPAYEAASIRMAKIDPALADRYMIIAADKISGLEAEYGSMTDGVVIEDGINEREEINPNLIVEL